MPTPCTASSGTAIRNACASQASSLQQTAASMEELTSSVQQSAENVGSANQLAEHARNVATEGGRIASQVVSTMEDISASSNRILDIIGLIDGIAFQANILALDAARAGEHGRGFAVVASEAWGLALGNGRKRNQDADRQFDREGPDRHDADHQCGPCHGCDDRIGEQGIGRHE